MRVHVKRTVQVHESATDEQVAALHEFLLGHEPVPTSALQYREQMERAVRETAEDFLWREREHVEVTVNVSVAEFQRYLKQIGVTS